MGARDLVFTILGIDRASRPLSEVGDEVDRLGNKLDRFGKVGAGGMAGVAATAVASGVLIGGAMAAATVGFGALGITAVAQSSQVSTAYSEMAKNITSDVREMSEPLAPMLVRVAADTESTFRALRPMIAESIEASGEHIETLSQGVLGFARAAMPGFTTAVKSAGPVMQGFKSLLIDTGAGAGEFFTEVSTSSASTGSILTSVGQIVHSVFGFFGRFFAQLSNEGAPTVQRVADTLDNVLQVTDDLGGGAMPVLFAAVDTGLSILNGLLGILGPITSQLGGVLGVVLAVSAGFKVLGAATGLVDRVGTSISGLGERAKAAGGGVTGLIGKAGGLLGVLGGPWGLAIAGAATVMAVLGQEQAETTSRTRDLTQALIASKGAIDENVRSVAINNLQQRGAFDAAKKLGVSQADLTDAYLGNAHAVHRVNKALQEYAASPERDDSDVFDYLKAMDGVGTELGEAKSAADNYAAAQSRSADATDAATKSSKERREALISERLEMMASVDKQFAYEQALRSIESSQLNVVSTQKAYAETLKKHKATSDEAKTAELQRRDAIGQLDQSIRTAMSSAADFAVSNSGATNDAERNRIALEAQGREALRLAGTWSGPLPSALTRSILAMDQTTLASLGVARSVDAAGASVYRLPDGKAITISATETVSAVAARVQQIINNIRGTVVNFGAVLAAGFGGGRPPPRAGGGPVKQGVLYEVGEEGSEFFMPDQDGTIIPADVTAAMKAATSGSPVSMATRSGAGGGGVWRVESGGSRLDDFIVELIRRFVKHEGGGDVQAAFGPVRR